MQRASLDRPVLAYVVGSLHPGGTERLVVEMSRAFAADYEVHVFCLDEPGLWAARLREVGIPVHCLWRQPGLDLGLPMALAKQLRACGAEIVHAHQCTPWFYAALSRLRYRDARLVLEEHGRFFPEMDSFPRRLVNRAIIAPLTERLVAVSEDVRRRLVRHEGLETSRIEVIYNGVTPAVSLDRSARDGLRRELGLRPEAFVVGTVGRLDPIKNLPMLVSSVAAARARDPRIQGLLVGDGPELGRLRELVSRCSAADGIQLAGFREDARAVVQCVDLFVLSSFSEGTSMALLEALAAGVPAAVTAVGGNPEIVVDRETGWVVPSGDIGALTTVILEAAANRAVRERFAAAGRQRFETQFTLERMISRYERLYRSLLDERSSERARA